ncbi:hypothetical protein [Deinococcus sedimenti]|uniref:hypothetical protein n=1 Tax=Deinococcus sedimenti TaxID=1867090 RepID=UPI001664C3AE|nr:hypothetical protein [Deinococcus sedimenti]
MHVTIQQDAVDARFTVSGFENVRGEELQRFPVSLKGQQHALQLHFQSLMSAGTRAARFRKTEKPQSP